MKKTSIFFFCLALFLLTSGRTTAQVSGASTVCPGATVTYTSVAKPNYQWTANGGTIVGSSTSNTVRVTWGNTPVSISVSTHYPRTEEYEDLSYYKLVSAYTGSAGTLSGQTTYCGTASGSVTVSGNTGPVYRWETSTDGYYWSPINHQATSHSFSGLTQNTSFRAVVSGNCAGVYYYSAPIFITVNPLPAPPLAQPVSRCGPGLVVLVATGSPSSYRWYTAQDVYLSSGNFYPATLNQSEIFKVSAVSAQGCESARIPVSATINALPPMPPSLKTSYDCGDQTVISVDAAPAGFTHYWQATFDGTSEANASLTRTVNTSAYYYVRTKNNFTQCWGPSVATYIHVYEKPAPPPAPTVEIRCNRTVLRTETGSPIMRYFWQTTPNGISTVNSDLEYTVNTPGTYYLRAARTNANPYCWSDAVAVPVTIDARISCLEGQARNYIVTNTILREGVKAVDGIVHLQAEENDQVISYIDGLGRTVQQVNPQSSPQKKDVVQIMAYDRFGRQSKRYLPYTSSSDGRYAPDALTRLAEFYTQADKVAHTAAPWAETRYEASALNEVREQGAPGEEWQINPNTWSKTILTTTSTNGAAEVRRWTYDFNTGVCRSSGYYDAGALLVEESKDEHRRTTRQYKDQQGNVVCIKKNYTAADVLQTYYVFDSFSRLRMIVQPEGVKALLATTGEWTPDAAFIAKWCFTNQYDNNGRVKAKTVPGAAPVYYVYNKRDMPILTQDGRQRERNAWSFTKYDALKRVVSAGEYRHETTATQEQMQDLADAHAGQFETRTSENYNTQYGYTVAKSFPVLIAGRYTLHTVNYFDDYDFDQSPNTAEAVYIAGGLNPEPVPLQHVYGLATGSRVNVSGTAQMLLAVKFYDKRKNVIQTQSDNHLGGKDMVTERYDFNGRVLESKHAHSTANGQPMAVRKVYAYNHRGKLLSLRHQVNSGPLITMAAYGHNELGQEIEKKLHEKDGSGFLQKVDFRYNIRGWLNRINDAVLSEPSDLFGMELRYTEGSLSFTTPTYNEYAKYYDGRIGEIQYNDRLQNKLQAYTFFYDAFDKMTQARYAVKSATGWNQDMGTFDEYALYDLNGNITSLRRYEPDDAGTGKKLKHDLHYTYSGNQLTEINDLANPQPLPEQEPDQSPPPGGGTEALNASAPSDASGEPGYRYDANGNVVYDGMKGIDSLTYNHLNMVERIVMHVKGEIRYRYNASGGRLSKTVTDSVGRVTSRYYVAGFEYNDAMTLEHFATEEGRVVMKGGMPEYQYHLKDHLGNIRITFTSSPATETAKATFETTNANVEHQKFLHAAEAIKVNHTLFDHTGTGATHYASRLSGTPQERTGLARSLSVMPGDVVRAEVYAKYVDSNRSNWNAALTNLMTAIATGTAPAGTVVDGGLPGSLGNATFPLGGMLDKSSSTGAGPKAYLNYILVDRQYNFVDGGYVRLSENARETGTDVPHEKLEKQLTITVPGYVYLYLSNENDTPVDVYFDDFAVEHVASMIMQGDQYYPFGLTYNSFARENSTGQNYLYSGKELQRDLGLDWYDFGARMYNPVIGRWNGSDPLAHKFDSWSPYAYALNNPVTTIDPDGKEAIVVSGGEFDQPHNGKKRYKYNFIEPALLQLKTLKENGSDKSVTWAVAKAGYDPKDVEYFKFAAEKMDVKFVEFSSGQQLTTYINSKLESNYPPGKVEEARREDPVTGLYVFGHGVAGSAELAYNQSDASTFSWSGAWLDDEAFKDAVIELYTCNAATPQDDGGNSLAQTIANETKTSVKGYRGKTDYAQINKDGGVVGSIRRKLNNIDFEGSKHLPSAGEGAVQETVEPWRQKNH